jgi:nicotinic acid mononucleotide adenylyltransferase
MAKTIAVYGGGFKPPTSGHFEVIKTALKQNHEIDE